jgi:D-alanine-D-alanine ligase
MRVAIAFNDDADLRENLSEVERVGEREVVSTADEVRAALAVPHECSLLPVRDDAASAIEQLARMRPDIVFNLCEGVAGRPEWESNFASALEMLQIPLTGCGSVPLKLAQNKALAKRLLLAAGVPVARGMEVTPDTPQSEIERWLDGVERAIVKPVREDAGIGIGTESVVSTAAQALERCRFVHARYRQPALVEEFIDGSEYNQSMFCTRGGLVLLPPGEVVFADDLAPAERVVGAKAKWESGSREDLGTRNRTPARLDAAARERLASICTRSARALVLDGYFRFDLRRDAGGEFRVIDANPNPDIGSGTGFRKALDAAAISFPSFLDELMLAKLATSRRP